MSTRFFLGKTKFSLGHIHCSEGAAKALLESGQTIVRFLALHVCGNWGDVLEETQEGNYFSLKEGGHLFSRYWTKNGVELWVITEADRTLTTVFLPEEY